MATHARKDEQARRERLAAQMDQRVLNETWATRDNHWFQASAAGTPAPSPPVDDEILDPGYHVPAGGALDLIVAGVAGATYFVWRRSRRRQPR
jgi:hypothetical protein